MYNYGLSPTNYRGMADANMIQSPTGAVSNAQGSYAPESQGTTQGAGGIQASNASLQNITNFAGSLGTLSGNYNQQRGLENYNSYNQQKGLGGIGGQTTPWGLRSQAEGGFGGDLNSRDYFVNPSAQGITAGKTFDYSNNGLQSRDNIRNAYTGEIEGYGGYQNVDLSNPLSGFFANRTLKERPRNATGVGTDFRDYSNQIDQLVQQYINSMDVYGQGWFNVDNVTAGQFDPAALKKQLVMSLNPTRSTGYGSTPEYMAWANYMNQAGYSPYGYANVSLR